MLILLLGHYKHFEIKDHTLSDLCPQHIEWNPKGKYEVRRKRDY